MYITKTIGHICQLTYLVQLLYLGKVLRLKYDEFSHKLLIFQMLQYLDE